MDRVRNDSLVRLSRDFLFGVQKAQGNVLATIGTGCRLCETRTVWRALSPLRKRMKALLVSILLIAPGWIGTDILASEPKGPHPIAEPKNSWGYRISIASALEKVYREDDYAPDPKTKVEVAAARNEYESFQVVIEAPWRSVSIEELRASDLKNQSGGLIPASAIKWERVDYVQTTVVPPYPTERGVGWYPDPLVPAGPFVVTKLSRTPIWFTLKTPRNCPAGRYRGTITIRPVSGKLAEVPVTLTVWDFGLTDQTHLRTMTWLAKGNLRAFYGNDRSRAGEKRQAEVVRNYEDFLLEHRIGPGGECANGVSKDPQGKYDFQAVDATLQRLIGRGMNAFIMGTAPNLAREGKTTYGPHFVQQFTKMLKTYSEHLRQKGWLDMAYVYVYDEAPKAAWPEVKRLDQAIKQTAPGLRIFQCLNEPEGVKELTGFADVFDVYVAQYQKSGVAQAQKKGAEAWLALCCYPMQHPNFFIEYPLVDIRATPWLCWKYQAKGFEYWSPVAWGTNLSRPGEKWPKVAWVCNTFGRYNGDGHLIYPGPNLTPYSSIRLEALRAGLQDYEYLWTLANLLNKGQAAGCRNEVLQRARNLLSLKDVMSGTGTFAPEAAKYLVFRRKLAEAIVELKTQVPP